MIYLRFNVTSLCNFKCKYCHVKNYKENGNSMIKYEIIENYLEDWIDIAQARYQNKMLVNFYGGETLLLKKKIFPIIEKYSKILAKKNIRILWRINTNGSLLTEEDCIFIKKYNVRIHISCDGPKEINDKTRISKSHESTYKIITDKIKLLKKHNCVTQINSYIQPENINHLKQIIDIALKYNLHDVYIDWFYTKEDIDLIVKNKKELIFKFKEVFYYAFENKIKLMNFYLDIFSKFMIFSKNYKEENSPLFTTEISTEGSFFFTFYPFSKNKPYKKPKELFSSIKLEKKYKEWIRYYDRLCKDCEFKNI